MLKNLQFFSILCLIITFNYAQEQDCAGVINGTAIVDDCGDCRPPYCLNLTNGIQDFEDASDLSSGVYLISAEYAGQIFTQKVTLMK